MENSKLDIEGIDEILAALDSLPSKMATNILLAANKKVLSGKPPPGSPGKFAIF